MTAGQARSSTLVAPVWPALRSTGGDAALWVGGAVCGLAIVVAAIAVAAAPSASVLGWALLAALLAVVGAAILVWGFAYRRLTYTLGEQSLGVTWFGQTLVVPYASVEGIYTGQRLVGSSVPKVLTWPGIYVGPGRARGIRRLRFFATSPDPSALTLIACENVGLVVSAREPLVFRNALIERVQAFEPSDGESTAWVKRNEASAPWTAIRDRWFGACVGVAFVFLMLTLVADRLWFRRPAPRDRRALRRRRSGDACRHSRGAAAAAAGRARSRAGQRRPRGSAPSPREAACSAAVDRRRRRTRHRVRGCRSSAPVTDTTFADLIRLIDELEGRAEGYLTLPEVEAAGGQQVDAAIEASILLVDHRTRLDVTSGELASVTLCRLNRQHPLVKELTSW